MPVQQARLTLCSAPKSSDVPCWCMDDTKVSARDIRQMAASNVWMIVAVAFLVRFRAAVCCARVPQCELTSPRRSLTQ